jgi:hypothetical protein
MRTSSLDELRQFCRGIRKSFVHLETRDSYGTETELPHLARWRRGEPDDYAWLDWWLEMLREHRTAGRACRRARVVSEPLSEYQQWVLSSAALFADAGEGIRYVPRPRLTMTSLPCSGDFYVFDGNLIMFLHYAGNGSSTAFEVTDEPQAARAGREAFEIVWQIATPLREYRPA